MTNEERLAELQKELGIVSAEVETPSTETPAVEKPTTEELTPDSPTFKIKFDGQDLELTQEDAIKFAQLGKFYENKVKPEFEGLKSHAAIKMVNDLAREFGLSPEDFVKATYAEAEAARVENAKRQFGIEDDELAKRLVSQDVKLAELESFKRQQEIDTLVDKQIASFSTKYPDVDLGVLPQEVTANVQRGMDLTVAYELHTVGNKDSKIADMQAEIDRLKANANNTDTAPPPIGNASSGAIADVTSPDFGKNVKGKEDLDAWVKSLTAIYKNNKK